MDRGTDAAMITIEHDLEACLDAIVHDPWHAVERLLLVCCGRCDAHAGRLLVPSPESGELEVLGAWSASTDDARAIEAACGAAPTTVPDEATVTTIGGRSVWTIPVRVDREATGRLDLLTERPDVERVQATVRRVVPLVRAQRAFRDGLRVVPPIPDISGDEASFGQRVYEYLDAHVRAALVAVFVVSDDLDVSLAFAPSGPEERAFLESDIVADCVAEVAITPGTCASVSDRWSRGRRPPVARSCTVLSALEIPGGTAGGTYVLLVGFRVHHEPTPAETAALQHALAIAAYLHRIYGHLHQLAADAGEVAEIGSAITGLETSQMTRHHAKNQIELAQNLILELQRGTRNTKDRLDALAAAVQEVADDLEAIKVSTRAPSQELRVTSLKSMWDSACAQVRWRLAARRVDLRYDGPDVDVIAAPDWFRQVFLNLLLNSADAYDAAQRRGGKVTLRVHPVGAGADRVSMTYSDDATGVQPHHFLSCEVAAEVDLSERIFRPGVTSKRGGSGWGLYVCRNIVSRTPNSSISFSGGRTGVTFEIAIGLADRQSTERNA